MQKKNTKRKRKQLMTSKPPTKPQVRLLWIMLMNSTLKNRPKNMPDMPAVTTRSEEDVEMSDLRPLASVSENGDDDHDQNHNDCDLEKNDAAPVCKRRKFQ